MSKGLGSTKHFQGVKASVYIKFFNKKFSWQNKIWRSAKKFSGDCLRMPLMASGLIPIFRISR